MRKIAYVLLLLGMIMIPNIKSSAQIKILDTHGDSLPTPTWPPPDSLYIHNTITVWFNKSVINKSYLCSYWSNYYNPENMIARKSNPKLQTTYIPGCFDVDNNIITDTNIINVLHFYGATQMCQISDFNPCVDTLSITRKGDTIRMPEFWDCFTITIDSTKAVLAVSMLNLLYAGTKIDFAELIPVSKLDKTPVDTRWSCCQSNYYNLSYSQDIVSAWDIEDKGGIRDIKVAVVDDGIDYTHRDFGGNIGSSYRVVDGMEFPSRLQPPTNGGGHGTPVAGLIGANTNNDQDVAGIAGGWYGTSYDGVSIYDLKCPTNGVDHINRINAWIKAAAKSSSSDNGFEVNIISNSQHSDYYVELWRRVLDFAYRNGVSCFISRGNDNINQPSYPGDNDYNKIVSVGSYGIKHEYIGNLQQQNWIPTRYRASVGSTWGYGIDILAQGDNDNNTILLNNTLQNGGGVQAFSQTSAACPQVAAVGALIMSYKKRVNPSNIDYLYPEDIQGLLCISAQDNKYKWGAGSTNYDSAGYDAENGYGILKAGTALTYMESPYILRHFTTTGGTDAGYTNVSPFWALAPYEGTAQLPAGKYSAKRHKVQKTVSLIGWEIARSWGLGGDGTLGWSASQPTDAATNNSTMETGWCMVLGTPDAQDNNSSNFNNNNIREISYSNDEITLQTFCYEIYQYNTSNFVGWYPCAPQDVVYRYTIWGKLGSTGVEDNSSENTNSPIIVNTEIQNLFGGKFLRVIYQMEDPGPIALSIYDNLGNLIYETSKKTWNNEQKQIISIPIESFKSGAYFVKVTSKGNSGFSKFMVVN